MINAQIRECLSRLEQFMGTVTDALALPRDAAEFTHAVVLARGARRALEIGTSYGYSGVWIASALADGGTLVTIDHDVRKSDIARGAFASAGLADRIDIRTGPAMEMLHQVTGPFDFVLIDADKDHCIQYVGLIADKLSPRSVVLTDNTATHSAQLAEFMAYMRRRPDFHTVNVPIGNGMDMSVRLPGS